MMTRQSKTCVYVDSMNIINGVGKINFRVLMKYLKARYETQTNQLSVKIFIPVYSEAPDSRDGFINSLKKQNYQVFRADSFKGFGKSNYKDNTDIVMVVQMIDDLVDEDITKFVLMSGDKDFLFVLERIIHSGRDVEVIGPAQGTCYEYRTMQGFTRVESIPNIFLNKQASSYLPRVENHFA